MLHLVGQYGSERVEAACARALAHDSPYYRTVKTILASGVDLQPVVDLATPTGYAQAPRFARDAQSLFSHPQPDTLH